MLFLLLYLKEASIGCAGFSGSGAEREVECLLDGIDGRMAIPFWVKRQDSCFLLGRKKLNGGRGSDRMQECCLTKRNVAAFFFASASTNSFRIIFRGVDDCIKSHIVWEFTDKLPWRRKRFMFHFCQVEGIVELVAVEDFSSVYDIQHSSISS